VKNRRSPLQKAEGSVEHSLEMIPVPTEKMASSAAAKEGLHGYASRRISEEPDE
jgi:hypothetical protein